MLRSLGVVLVIRCVVEEVLRCRRLHPPHPDQPHRHLHPHHPPRNTRTLHLRSPPLMVSLSLRSLPSAELASIRLP